MRPTPGQIRRAHLVATYRRRFVHGHGIFFYHYCPDDLFGSDWPLDDVYNGPALRPDQYAPNLPVGYPAIGRTRTIVNPPRPRPTPPDLELPDDFPY